MDYQVGWTIIKLRHFAMKRIITFSLFALIIAACGQPRQKPVEVASPESILDSMLTDITVKSRDTLVTEEQLTSLNMEYADSLYSIIVNSKIDEFDQRLCAQDHAVQAASAYLECCESRSFEVNDLVFDKYYRKVLLTWRSDKDITHPDSSGVTLFKEVLYTINQNTDEEKKEGLLISIKLGNAPCSYISIPKGEDDAELSVIFFQKNPSGGNYPYDMKEGSDVTINPESMSRREDGRREYRFPGNGFYETAMQNYRIFVLYTDSANYKECATFTLDGLHEIAATI